MQAMERIFVSMWVQFMRLQNELMAVPFEEPVPTPVLWVSVKRFDTGCSLNRTCPPWPLSPQRSSADRLPSTLVWSSDSSDSLSLGSTSCFDLSLFLPGTIGHVAHGKSTVVKAISGVHTVRFKNELERNITIKLGYANAKVSSQSRPLTLTFPVWCNPSDLFPYISCRSISWTIPAVPGLNATGHVGAALQMSFPPTSPAQRATSNWSGETGRRLGATFEFKALFLLKCIIKPFLHCLLEASLFHLYSVLQFCV